MKRVEALDFARVLSMLAVIVIHVTAPYMGWNSDVTVCGMNLAFILNQACRFSVPLFILLSGTALGLKDGTVSAVPFWKKRFAKVGIPYVVWFILYELNNHDFRLSAYLEDISAAPAAHLRRFLLGQAAPHLYFISILLQLYLLYPLIEKTLRKAPRTTLGAALAVTCTAQLLFDLGREGVWLLPSAVAPYWWMLFPVWLAYFVLGACCSGEVLSKTEEVCKRNGPMIVGATAAALVAFVLRANATENLSAVKLSLLPVTVLVLLGAMALWKLMGRWSAVRTINAFLAKHSMTVYFCHVLILGLIRDHAVFYTGMRGMLLLVAADFILSLALAVVIDTSLQWSRHFFQRRNHHD